MRIEKHRIDPITQREQWLALRRQDVTASVAAALFGIDPYKSRWQLWHEKAGRIEESAEETDAMLRGKLLEDDALQVLSMEKPGWRIWQPNVYLRDPAARLGATPDAFAADPERPGFGVVQVKSVSPRAFRDRWHDEDGEPEPPLYVVVQTILEAHLAQAQWAAVLALIIDNGIRVRLFDVPIHAGIIKRVREETAKFWESIEANDPPPPDYGRDGSLLTGLYADDNGREIDLSGDNMLPALLEEREQINARLKADRARLEAINAEIIDKLGEHERGYLPGWSIKRPLVRRKGFYVEPTEFRRLSIKKLD